MIKTVDKNATVNDVRGDVINLLAGDGLKIVK
jgi:hypothetical protein